MYRLSSRLEVFVLLVILSFAPALAQRRPADPPRTAQAAVDEVVQRAMQARRIPGAAVAVIENGTTVLQRAYGLANLETEAPMTVRSKGLRR